MRGRIVIFLMIVVSLCSCEDPSTLSVSKAFSGNNIQTIYSDTFSVVTSTVQLDTFLTSNTGTVLLGSYEDPALGKIWSSSYLQINTSTFLPDLRSIYDSALLIMEYNHTYSGDTTQLMKINGYQLTEPMLVRLQPVGTIKLSAFNYGNGFFSSSSFTHTAAPIFSGSFRLYPGNHKADTVWMRLPDKLGAQWFRVAQNDSAHVFSIPSNFLNSFFYGLYLEPDPSSMSSVVGFNAATLKIRIYYKKFVGNYLTRTFQDFKINGGSNGFQFNNIKHDRTGSPFLPATLQAGQGVSSTATQHITFVQPGTGLVTRLDFPSVKNFFVNKPSYVLNAAYLEIDPLQGTYPKNFLPPSQLQLYITDYTNIPITSVSGGTASISYDLEYGLNTQYTFQLFSYLFGQIKSGTNFTSPLFLAASGSPGTNVQRLYLGDRFHPETKIKLKIYYSYAQN